MTRTKQSQNLKEKITPIDDGGPKMRCSLANRVLTP